MRRERNFPAKSADGFGVLIPLAFQEMPEEEGGRGEEAIEAFRLLLVEDEPRV
jgi:hypothetical protein